MDPLGETDSPIRNRSAVAGSVSPGLSRPIGSAEQFSKLPICLTSHLSNTDIG